MQYEQEELDQIEHLFDKLRKLDGRLVRRWSFEAEHECIARAKHFARWSDYSDFTTEIDGSVDCDYDYCDCSCRDCVYHDCNCENCEDQNDSPDHCSDESCTANEISPRSPLRTFWDAKYNGFLQSCEEIEDNYSADYSRLGGHLHIEARDLTREQSRNVLLMMERIYQISPEWFTGEHDDYNNAPDRRELAEYVTKQRNYLDRAWTTSLYNLQFPEPMDYDMQSLEWDGRKTTIEFRRFRTTFNSGILAIRGGVARAVVAYAQTNAPIYWVMKCQSFEEVLEAIGFGSH